MDPVCTLITTEWDATIKKTAIDVQSWEKPLSRHIKLAAFVAGQGSPSEKCGGRSSSVRECAGVAGFHPIHCASSQGMLSAVRVFLKDSCSAQEVPPCEKERLSNLRDGSGRSPLHWAAIMGETDVMSLLIDHGASLECRDPSGRTPLFSCAAFGHVATVKLLLQRGADQNANDGRGLTPLHAAASGGHLDAVYVLLSAHADPRCRTAVGATPRHIAERHGHVQMANLLVAAERRAGAAAAACGKSTHCPRNVHGPESFLAKLRRDQCSTTRQSA